jgi:hypothetical protein
MWADLLEHTGPEAATALRAVVEWTENLAERLHRGDVHGVAELMARTRAWRTEGSETSGDRP